MNKIILLAIFVSGIFLNTEAKEAALASRADKVERAQDYYTKGKEYLEQGDYQKADEYFRMAEESLGSVEYKVGKREDNIIQEEDMSKQEVQENVKGFDKNTEKITQELVIQPQGVKSKKDILEDRKKTEEVNNNILKEAREKYQEGNIDEVLNLYKQVIEKYPKNYNLHYNLGVIYLKKADYSNAAEEFETVIKLNRRDKDAYYNLGIIYESFLDEKDKSIEYYKKYSGLVSAAGEKKRIKSWIDYIKTGRIK